MHTTAEQEVVANFCICEACIDFFGHGVVEEKIGKYSTVSYW